MRKAEEIKGIIVLLLTTFIWGTTFSFTKLALLYFTPFFLLFLRFTLGLVTLFLYSHFKRQKILLSRSGIILGMLNFSAIAFQTFGLRYTSATKTAFITGLSVIFVPYLESVVFKSKIYWNLWLAVFFGFLGMTFLSADFSSFERVNWGDLLVFICAILYAAQIVYISYIVKKKEVFDLAFSEILFTAVFAFLFFLLFEPRNLPIIFIVKNSWPIIYLGVIATSITLTLQLVRQKYVSPTKSALIYNLEPVFATVFALVILSEKLTYFQTLGASFILLSLFISIPSFPQNN